MNQENDLQKAIDDITRSDAQKQADADLVAEIAQKFAEKAKAVPVENTEAGMGDLQLPTPEVPKIPEIGTVENGVPMPPSVENGGINNDGGNTRMDADVQQMKEVAMRDLMPLMDKLELSAEQKFNLCIDMLSVLRDKSMLTRAHEATRGIMDEGARAKALVRFVDVLNEMK